MQRPLSILCAALIAASSTAVTLAPAGATVMGSSPTYGDAQIIPVLNGHRVEGDGKPYGYYPNERNQLRQNFFDSERHHRRHHRRHCYHDWFGRLICRR